MPRPLPNIPRLRDRYRKKHELQSLLLACPRISPEWELAALQALMKPQKRGPILHREAQQILPKDFQQSVEAVGNALQTSIGFEVTFHWPASGDYWFASEVDAEQTNEARAAAVALTQSIPDVWVTVGKLFVRDGVFFRRQFGTKLNLVPAANVHLPKALRAAIRKLP